MIGKLLATSALLLVSSGAALAQTPASAVMANGYQMQNDDALASKVIGSAVYSTIAGKSGAANTNATPMTDKSSTTPAPAAGSNGGMANNANDTNAQQIGTIRDLVVGPDGSVKAAVLGVGGFLGMGEKNVAVDYAQVHWAVAQDGSIRGTLDTTADALKSAPAFNYPSSGQAMKTPAAANSAEANGGNTAAPMTAPAAPVAADAATNNDTTTAASTSKPDVDPASLKPLNMTDVKADDLKGTDVLDPAGHKIASVSDFVLSPNGKIDAVIVDFGGFLGIGSKQIALGFQGLKFMDDANGKHYLVVNVTRDQLKAQRAYNKSDYSANRKAERLVVTP